MSPLKEQGFNHRPWHQPRAGVNTDSHRCFKKQSLFEKYLLKNAFLSVFICVNLWLFFVVAATTVAAQTEYRLNVQRVFGFSSGSQIRGVFTLDVVGPEGILSVMYQIDGKVIGEVTDPPFQLRFETTGYPIGWHDLNAVVQTRDGRKAATPVRRYEFVSSEREMEVVGSITLPLLGGVFALIVAGMGLQFLILRNKPHTSLPLGAPRPYGLMGGGICPHCQRSYALHWWSFHVGNLRFDRCDYCSRWGWIRKASRAELAAAEAAELQQAEPVATPRPTAEEQLKEQIERSRYMDGI